MIVSIQYHHQILRQSMNIVWIVRDYSKFYRIFAGFLGEEIFERVASSARKWQIK